MIKVKRGLDLPVLGEPNPVIAATKQCQQVGLVGPDYAGMRPTLLVKPGDQVKIGQPVFTCKKNEGLVFTAPAAGKVHDIVRGEKRAFEALTITVGANELHADFKNYKSGMKASDVDASRKLLVESGMWTRIRERPYDKAPAVSGELPKHIFVSIADTNPLAAPPEKIIAEMADDFAKGLEVLEALAEKNLYVCRMHNQKITLPKLSKLREEEFKGPHPAGNVGTQMHYLAPPTLKSRVWYVGYQDVAAIGYLFRHGRLMTDRYVSFGGPNCRIPRIVKTRFGADLSEITHGEIDRERDPTRIISGSIFHGRTVEGAFKYLGAFHNQVSFLKDDHERKLLGWHMPGFDKFSVKGVFLSSLIPKTIAPFKITTSTNGSHRALVPFGHFEKVCAFDTLPTHLLRALLVGDTDMAQQLGALELGEEDMSLFTFVSTGKTDFGPVLRENLDTIEKEG